MKTNKPRAIIIMDGFGEPTNLEVSGILPENTPYIRELREKYTSGLIYASEKYVGLPMGQTGTSDIGHLTIGTGRINYQPLVRINNSIEDGSFDTNPAIMQAFDNAKIEGRALHLLGIPSDGGVHSHIDHLLKLIEMAAKHKIKKVYIHFFADGRDAPIKSAKKYFDIVQQQIDKFHTGEIVDVIGRMYALDRDNNWDRVEKAYDCMVNGKGFEFEDLKKGIDSAYANGETDEFIKPIIKVAGGKPVGVINPHDSVIIYNYRADRERQLARVLSDYSDIEYSKKLHLTLVTMTNYDENLKGTIVAFPNVEINNILSEVLSNRGYKQLKIAETEKFAYITFAFNASRIEPFPNEDRILINSTKLPKYDVKPEMGAYEIAEKAVEAIDKDEYDCIVINFANPDMVGHSGNKQATRIAIKVVNDCVEKVVKKLLSKNGEIILTADHGNADIMEYPDGSPCTTHTKAKVPVVLIGERFLNGRKDLDGSLIDIAPTLLKMMGEEIPAEMTGKPLF